MRGMPILLWAVGLATLFLLVGCTDGGSQAHQHGHASHSDNVKLELRPEHDSGVSGTASFEDTSNGVLVRLELRNLPKPNTLYLAHIHPGTCAEEEAGGGEHGHSHHEHGATEEIEYPLTPVEPDAKGDGTSTTVVHHVTLEGLLSGEPKLVNVHKPGSGEPPPVTCANLNEAV
jgi:hypothetical protein